MKIFVLGHRGMLGHVAVRYFQEQGHEVTTSERRYAGEPRDALVEAVRESGCTWVINAAGKIKQKSADLAELLLVNSQLPVHLSARLLPGQKLIHASTDCVFSGTRGRYATGDERDADDAYGFSKILGEACAAPGRTFILRTSIIGPAPKDTSGLMGWFLSQTQPVSGYRNHLWNGITTLEWAKAALELMAGTGAPSGPLIQTGVWPPVSKYELLQLIGAAWGHPVKIVPVDAAAPLDRTLLPEVQRPSLAEQLREFKEWYDRATERAGLRKGSESA